MGTDAFAFTATVAPTGSDDLTRLIEPTRARAFDRASLTAAMFGGIGVGGAVLDAFAPRAMSHSCAGMGYNGIVASKFLFPTCVQTKFKLVNGS